MEGGGSALVRIHAVQVVTGHTGDEYNIYPHGASLPRRVIVLVVLCLKGGAGEASLGPKIERGDSRDIYIARRHCSSRAGLPCAHEHALLY